jgi:chemotaxis protein methyltransferase CheR
MSVEFNEANFEKLAEYIYRKSGIALEGEKHFAKLNSYVTQRCEKVQLDNFRKYFYKLRFDDKEGLEFQELMNGITVNETYFFREENQLDVLAEDLLPELDKLRAPNTPLRILSAPSSTGEEPYSMVIKILEEDGVINRRDIEIVAIDIDSTVIEKAKKGTYTDRAVHAIPKNLYGKYFKKETLANVFSEDLRGAVDFRVVNIFDKAEVRALGKFDVIFSRNMLIYFDDASRKEVAMTFYDLLKPDGYVLLGHAEYMSRIVSVFNAKKVQETLVYQK